MARQGLGSPLLQYLAAAGVGTLALNLITIASVVLIPLVLTCFGVLYSVFGGPIEAGETC